MEDLGGHPLISRGLTEGLCRAAPRLRGAHGGLTYRGLGAKGGWRPRFWGLGPGFPAQVNRWAREGQRAREAGCRSGRDLIFYKRNAEIIETHAFRSAEANYL